MHEGGTNAREHDRRRPRPVAGAGAYAAEARDLLDAPAQRRELWPPAERAPAAAAAAAPPHPSGGWGARIYMGGRVTQTPLSIFHS